MTLKEVLQLPKDVHSLQLIKTYLNQPLDYHDQIAAFSHYTSILFHLFSYDVLIKEVAIFLDRYLTSDYDERIDSIMAIYIDSAQALQRYQDVKKMIEERKKRLPLLKQYLTFEQEYKYLEILNQLSSTWVLDQLQDHIPQYIQIKMKTALLETYITEGQYQLALEHIQTFTKEEKKASFETYILILDALQLLETILLEYKERNDQTYTHFDVYYLVKTYIALGEDQKVINLEVDHEAFMDQVHPYKMKYYDLLLHFYERIQNALSVKIYQQKLKTLKNQEKISKVETQSKDQKVNIELISQPKTKSIQTLERVQQVMKDLFSMHHDLSYRDDLRLKSILLNRLSHFDTYVIYKASSRTLYFYKKERFYDKKIKPEQLEHTFLKHMMHLEKDGFIERPFFEGYQDILTQKKYENLTHMYVYRFEDMILMFYFEKPIEIYAEDDDVLRLASQYLGYELASQDQYMSLMKQDIILNTFLSYSQVPVKYYFQGRIKHGQKAVQLLHVDKEETLQSYLEKMVLDDRKTYQDAMNQLINLNVKTVEIIYTISQTRVKEVMHATFIENDILIISSFENVQAQFQAIEDIQKDAMRDPLTKVMNFNAFKRDFESLVKHKVTFLLIDIQPHIIYLYGMKKYHAYFLDFTKETIKFFSEDQLYVLNDHQLIAIMPGNDIRTIERHLEAYQKMMTHYYSKAISSETYVMHIGILRYPVSTKQQDFESIMHYLHIALYQAKLSSNKRHDFSFSDYEHDLKEQYLLDQMHEAMNHDQFEIGFHQIIDQSSNKMWMYESFIYLKNLNVSHQDMVLIAKKRHRLFDLDMAHIKVVFEMLIQLYAKTSSYIKIVVPIDAETIKNPHFNAFITRYMMQYKIPKQIFHINIIGDLKASTYINLIKDLIGLGIGIQTSSLKVALYYPVQALHFDVKHPDEKMMLYLKSIQTMMQTFQIDFVIRNVLTKEIKQQLQKEMLTLIEGPIYKKLTKQQVFEKVTYKMSN
jgi:GGDEF domain-containing protein